MKNDLKYLSLEIENFKNIDKKIIDIGGKSLLVMGKNGSGKSSLIQALLSPMDTKIIPSEPIKSGESRSTISVKIGGTMAGEQKEYTLDMYFTPSNNKGRLVVTDENGENVKAPATFIKSLIGNVSFDVTAWLNDDKKKKLETIKKLTGVYEEVDAINNKIDGIKESRKYKKQRAEDLDAIVKGSGFSRVDIDKYSKVIDLKPLQQELELLSAKNKQYNEIELKVKGFKSEVVSINAKIESSKSEIERLKALIEKESVSIIDNQLLITKNQENIAKGVNWLENNKPSDGADINAKINEAIVHNEKCSTVSSLFEKQKELIGIKEDIDAQNNNIEKLEKERSNVMSKSQLPIKGLTFTNNDIFLDGIPLEEGQVNTAKIFDVGVEVAMAINPNLKTIFLHDGSLFDKDSLKSIVEKIESKGYQAIIEIVDYEGGDLEVKFTEEELK